MPKTKEATSTTPRRRSTKKAPTPEQIQLHAYEIYLKRSGAPGDPLADWVQAERELLQTSTKNGRATKATAAA